MSTAHTCVRSALTQAFRPSSCGTAASYSVASFLVPALAKPSRRPISSGRRRSKETSQRSDDTIARANDAATFQLPLKPTARSPRSCIPLPPHGARNDMQHWLAAIDPFLPAHLRRDQTDGTTKTPTVTPLDLAIVINAAQDVSLDILAFMGLVEGRWPAVIWVAKKLIEDGKRTIDPPPQLDLSVNIILPESERLSLHRLTENPVRTERVPPLRKPKASLDNFTSAPDSINLRHVAVKRALGQLWRSLGSMILASAERSTREAPVMPHVLEIIAFLHHVGLMPDSIYTYRPHENKYALQQPPTLHMLSSKILTALSDASWKAHEASVKSAKPGAKPSYFLGHEIPGSRYRVHVTEIGPELWLELVLWSCLHGGWTADGIAILEQVASEHKEHGWGLISWREIMLAEQQNSPSPSRLWKLFPMNGEAAASDADRARSRKTISSEVVTAFVDATANKMRVGVGLRGSNPEVVVKQLRTLKDFLDVNNLSLGSTSWDSVIARLIESGAFVPEKRPEALLRLFQLATGFGAEVTTLNASATTSDEVHYFFEPTTLPLNLLHRTMRAFINNGDLQGAMTTLTLLQQHTDENKQKSLQQFFEMLKNDTPKQGHPFTSSLPPVDFPAFEVSMPVPLRARLLDLATESGMHELGRWLLFAQDIDGPLIGRDLYNHRNVAASIVRFGTLSGENDLVMDIVKRVGTWSKTHGEQRMPAEVLTALVCSQIKLHRWDSVKGMEQYIGDAAGFKPRPIILSTFAAELLRLSTGPEEERLKTQDAFTDLLFAWEDLILGNIRNELHCILAIMSTTDDMWKDYCSQFLAFSSRQYIKLSTDDFNKVLSGILDGYGSSKARAAVSTWCNMSSAAFEAHRAPGGLLTMPRFQVGKGTEYAERPPHIELIQESGAKLTLQGRIRPNRQTLWVIFRKVQEEVEQRRWQGKEFSATEHADVRTTLRWAARLLYKLGYDYEDISLDMGSILVELAGLEPPAATNDPERLDGAVPRFGEYASASTHRLAFL
ncbi:hypothetical protein HBI09_052920 [Parastagonospora nodorum]|nr:hypothetical protein HBI09_052920 [Parastagonospora nodorum]KAH4202555.1 hypothetical protein HBH42_019790 [Parastagonospora nodorum]KAH5000959.1 hypothetical protein HBI77_152300 [Parastagonospora nodorum]